MGWSPFRSVGLTYRNSRSAGGYTLITPIGGDATYLIDADGRIVHRWSVPGLQPGYGYLLPGGNLLVRGQPVTETEVAVGQPAGRADTLAELDWDSNVLWRWEHPAFHHDMARMPNGNTLVIVWESAPKAVAEKIKGGLKPDEVARITGDKDFMYFILQGVGVGGRPRLEGTITDAILEIDPAGETVHTWHAYEHFDPEVDIIGPLDFPTEWTHLNAVELTPDGDVLISSQKLDAILRISWPDGKVLWRWGGLGRISHQHDPTITPDGTLLLFDNGAHYPLLAHSRVVEVDVHTGEIVWQYVGSPVFSMLSLHIAGAERLFNGNTLICEGESGRVFEVTRDCEVCWEWINPFVLRFKGAMSAMLFRAHRYSPEGPELRGRRLDEARWEELNRHLGLIKRR